MTRTSRFILLALALAGHALTGCKKSDAGDVAGWQRGTVCIATVPGVEGPAESIVGRVLKDHGVRYYEEGSLGWAVMVQADQADLARSLLRTNPEIVIIGEKNGVLMLKARTSTTTKP